VRTVPNPTHRCRRCGYAVVFQDSTGGWKHARGGKSSTPTCGQRPDVMDVSVPFPERWPRWSVTPQDDKGYVVRRDREEMAAAPTREEACARLVELAGLHLAGRRAA
jgi:hypothetical protein